MKVIIIPDIHLKPWIFDRAAELLKNGSAERAVCLMDIPDDWNKEFYIELYEQTYNAAIDFAKVFPDTLWCYGNHDLCYLLDERESGYSRFASNTVVRKLGQLKNVLEDEMHLQVIHRIDRILFCHGGLSEAFAKYAVGEENLDSVDAVIDNVNQLPLNTMWNEASPIWCRPQYGKVKMFGEKDFLQVVGHTPVTKVFQQKNVLSCDTFSTYRDGRFIGNCEYAVVDTETMEWTTVK